MKHIRCPNCNTAFDVRLKYSLDKFSVFYCQKCLNGFTYPMPSNMAQYYHNNYWSFPSFLGLVRKLVYQFFQGRRVTRVREFVGDGKILDVGAGEGIFGRSLNSKYKIVSIDAPFAKVTNKEVLKVDFLDWRANRKFDAIVFWESLEHTPTPQKYLKKSFELLKAGGFLFIEYPRFNCLESELFGRYWYHLDLPRHLAHLTDEGLKIILARTGFKQIFSSSVFAAEHSMLGFLASIINFFRINALNLVIGSSKNPILLSILLIISTPILALSMIIETVILLFGQSPIGIQIARKPNIPSRA